MKTTLFTFIAAAGLALPAAGQTVDTRAVREAAAIAREHARAVYVVREQRGGETQTERQTKTVKIGADGELEVRNIAGDITVTRGSGGTATIDIVKTARAGSVDEAKQMLAAVQVEVNERSGRAEVTTRYPQDQEGQRMFRRNFNVSVAYTISAPAATRLTVRTIAGNVKVSDIKGELALNSVSGNVTVNNAGLISTVKSISGDVEITDAQLDGALSADSVSGNVVLRRVRGGNLSLGTISGNVTMTDIQCDRAEAHSLSGDVEFGGTLAKNGRYELKSHSGDVRIAVAGNAGFELEANSFSGSVRSDLPMTMQGDDRRDDRGPRRRTVHGVYGDGSAVINVTTFSGDIVIAKR